MRKVLKISCNDWKNESRDKRELAVFNELDFETIVLAKGETGDKGRVEMVDGFKVYRYGTRPLGNSVPTFINRIASIIMWAKFSANLGVDVISGHNMDGLFIGWLSNCFSNHKAKLIYDSHEFELGLEKNKGKVKGKLVRSLEKFLINRCEIVMMVSDEIAKRVQAIHKLSYKPVVVRNLPNYFVLDENKIDAKRKDFIDSFESKDVKHIVIYHGGVAEERGIEQLIDSVLELNSVGLVILGNASSEYRDKLIQRVNKTGISSRVFFHDAVPAKVLWEYVAAADIGVSLLQPTCDNHLLALPNKFFENIQCLNPVVVSDFPEIGSIVDSYNIGIKVDPTAPHLIADAIRSMTTDREYYKLCKNVKLAKEQLCWGVEKSILEKAIKDISFN